MRLVLIGTPGSGKTTLAREIARATGHPHIEADSLRWGPHWTPFPVEEAQKIVIEATARSEWIFDGNYRQVLLIALASAEYVVWLDYPLMLVLWRLLRRTLRRLVLREELWHGNRERLRYMLRQRWLFLHVIESHAKKREEYPALLQAYPHVHVVRLRSPRQANTFLALIKQSPSSFPDPLLLPPNVRQDE